MRRHWPARASSAIPPGAWRQVQDDYERQRKQRAREPIIGALAALLSILVLGVFFMLVAS